MRGDPRRGHPRRGDPNRGHPSHGDPGPCRRWRPRRPAWRLAAPSSTVGSASDSSRLCPRRPAGALGLPCPSPQVTRRKDREDPHGMLESSGSLPLVPENGPGATPRLVPSVPSAAGRAILGPKVRGMATKRLPESASFSCSPRPPSRGQLLTSPGKRHPFLLMVSVSLEYYRGFMEPNK